MKIKCHNPLPGFTLALLLTLFVSCGTPTGSTGSAASSTPTAAQASPAATQISPTPTATPSPIPTPIPPGLGDTYTFVRNNQLWIALHGAAPIQVTHFTVSDGKNTGFVAYGQPLWFDQDRYLAFTLDIIIDGGLGGGGCGFTSNFGRDGGLYIVDTSSMKVSQLTVAGDPPMSGPYHQGGFFEFLFRQDASHLLAWHGIGQASGDPAPPARDGLYRYDFATGSLTQILQASKLPGVDNQYSWFPMRYSNGQLYYEAMTPAGNKQTYNYTIYRHSISEPDTSSSKVLDAGNEIFCQDSSTYPFKTGPYTGPGFDLAPDGTYLAAQTLTGSPDKPTTRITLLTLSSGATRTIFQDVPSQFLNQDADLTWSPDSTTLLLTEVVLQQNGSSVLKLYSTSLTNSSASHEYSTSNTGSYFPHLARVLWHQSSEGFALYMYHQGVFTTPADTFLYILGQDQPQILLKDARNFAWGE